MSGFSSNGHITATVNNTVAAPHPQAGEPAVGLIELVVGSLG